MSIWFILIAMIFLHIIDDYVLQAPCLCNLKQKSFWEKNAPEKLYESDYIVALLMHAFSWSFMIMLPLAYVRGFDIGFAFSGILLCNTIVHAITDHLKQIRERLIFGTIRQRIFVKFLSQQQYLV